VSALSSFRNLRWTASLAGAVGALALAPGAASAYSGFPVDAFSFAGSGRATLVVTAPGPIQGLPPAPAGYYRVCSSVSPALRFRARFAAPNDVRGSVDNQAFQLNFSWVKGFSSGPVGEGTTAINTETGLTTYPGTAQVSGVMDEVFNTERFGEGRPPRLPKPGTYGLVITPLVVYFTGVVVPIIGSLGFPIPQLPLVGSLTIRIGTAAECATPTQSYFRA
jgi:hypothetical protein